MINRPKALVLEAPGINCNEETAAAIEQAGADPERVHLSQLRSGERQLSNYTILALPGGFSHGDSIRSGAILGQELKTRFGDDLNDFVGKGRAIIGICNGFQTLVETGLLPNGIIDDDQPKTASLIHNESGKFESRWVHLSVGKSVCRFVVPTPGNHPVPLPVAHAEGRFVSPIQSVPEAQIVFRYTDSGGNENVDYPENPNGSPGDIAGITDPSGVVLGLMPHPERYVTRTQHPNWRRDNAPEIPYGADLFRGLVNYAKRF